MRFGSLEALEQLWKPPALSKNRATNIIMLDWADWPAARPSPYHIKFIFSQKKSTYSISSCWPALCGVFFPQGKVPLLYTVLDSSLRFVVRYFFMRGSIIQLLFWSSGMRKTVRFARYWVFYTSEPMHLKFFHSWYTSVPHTWYNSKTDWNTLLCTHSASL